MPAKKRLPAYLRKRQCEIWTGQQERCERLAERIMRRVGKLWETALMCKEHAKQAVEIGMFKHDE